MPFPQSTVSGDPDSIWRCYFQYDYETLLPTGPNKANLTRYLSFQTLQAFGSALNTTINISLVEACAVLNTGQGIMMEYVFANATIVSGWKRWMVNNENFTVNFNGVELTALAASAAPPPDSKKNNSNVAPIIAGVLAGVVLLALGLMVAYSNGSPVGKRAKRQPPASQVTTLGMTELHLAVMQQDLERVRAMTVPTLDSGASSQHSHSGGLSAPDETDVASSQPSPFHQAADSPLVSVADSPVTTGAEAFSALATIAQETPLLPSAMDESSASLDDSLPVVVVMEEQLEHSPSSGKRSDGGA
jgi:hypothetical protein